MRLGDLLGLPLAALWQQKSRTCLTTLGVVFGSFVLAASLSINQGVQDTIERESHRNDIMRKIVVRPDWIRAEPAPGADDEPVAGNMSDERRKRIGKALAAEKRDSRPVQTRIPLTREMLVTLSGLEHVETVVPVVWQAALALVDHRPQQSATASVRPDDAECRRRLLVGRFFDSPSERAAIVSEFLMYRCGLLDDADLTGIIGKTLRLELSVGREGAGIGVYLSKTAGNETTAEESAALGEIRKQLPDLLEFFNLTPSEIEMLRLAAADEPARTDDEYVAEFPIVGVVRLPKEDELQEPWDPLRVNSDIILPFETACDLYFRSSRQAARGLDQIVVFVDRDEHVKEVFEKIKALGLQPSAALEYIERERFMNSLIFGGMTCVAAVALLVAALGIANTMLMSVLERTREIGIMKAVGASNGQLVFIFLLEGGLIGLAGGGLGMLLAWGASFPGDNWVRTHVSSDVQVYLTEAVFVFPPWLIASVLLFAGLVTTLAAVYPARRAAHIDPVAALRHE